MKPFFRLCHGSRVFLRVGVACLLTLLGTLVVIVGPSPVTHATAPCRDGWHLEGNVCWSNCNPGTHEVGYDTGHPLCITDARDPSNAVINVNGTAGKCLDGFSFRLEDGLCY